LNERKTSSVRIEWKTNVPTESKLFLTDHDGEIRIYKSQTGLSTNHFVSVGSFEGITYLYEIESIGRNGFAKKSGTFNVEERPTPIPTKMKVIAEADFMFLGDTDEIIYVSGGKCGVMWFGVIILDQYGNRMANEQVTLTTPAGKITKATSEKGLDSDETSFQGMRIYYIPATKGIDESISFSINNLVTIKTIRVRDRDEDYSNNIVKDGTDDEIRWKLQHSGQSFDPETMTCITGKPVLY